MSNTCFLVANSSEAKIYEAYRGRLIRENEKGEDVLNLIKALTHEESRKKVSDLVSDKSGNYPRKGSIASNGSTGTSGTFAEPTNPKELEAERFARILAHELDSLRYNAHWNDVFIVAAPHFQGLVNKYLSSPLQHLVTTIEKDYTHLNARKLAKQLVAQL
ncbi:hypothetical protein BH10PSE19_BH10PSE19_11580 [soil metagenome]